MSDNSNDKMTDERKEKRSKFLKAFKEYLAMKYKDRKLETLAMSESFEIDESTNEIRQKYDEMRSTLDYESKSYAGQFVRSLTTKEAWDEAIAEWNDDRKRELEIWERKLEVTKKRIEEKRKQQNEIKKSSRA